MTTAPTISKPLRLVILAAVCLSVIAGSPFIGASVDHAVEVMSPQVLSAFDAPQRDIDATIFWTLRMPRVLMACLAGAALAAGGMAFQSVFRNALATPYTLGVSSGAALGAAICIGLGAPVTILLGAGVTVTTISLAAFAGAIIAILIVYGLSRTRHGLSTETMLLAGVALNFFFGSLILLIQLTGEVADALRILRWLVGGLAEPGMPEVINTLPFVVLGAGVLFACTRELNLLMTGADLAMSRGVDVARTQKIIFAAVSVMIAAVVAVCGPIGFVGMMAPHICRLWMGADHRYLLPASLLFGGAFLAGCDTLARTMLYPSELPVGVITALLGGPFFIWLLLSKAKSKRHA